MLVLEIIQADPSVYGFQKTHVFSLAGGSIGRSDRCDWVLPDPERLLSSEHAKIRFVDGQYQLLDCSTNGTLRADGTALTRHQGYALQEGQVYVLGRYHILIKTVRSEVDQFAVKEAGFDHIINESTRTAELTPLNHRETVSQHANLQDPLSYANAAQQGPAKTDPFQALFEPVALAEVKTQARDEHKQKLPEFELDEMMRPAVNPDRVVQTTMSAPVAAAAVNPAFAPVAPTPAAPTMRPVTSQAPVPPQSFAPQTSMASQTPIMPRPQAPLFERQPETPSGFVSAATTMPNQNYATPVPTSSQYTQPITERVAQSQSPVRAPARTRADAGTAAAEDEFLEMFCQYFALDQRLFDRQDRQELYRLICDTLGSLLQGMITLMVNRAKIKNALKLDMTMIQPSQNNPMKFAVNARQALEMLLRPQGSAFLEPKQAIEAAVAETVRHEEAMYRSLRTSVKGVTGIFDPHKAVQAERSTFASKVPLLANMAAWRDYQHYYQRLAENDADKVYQQFMTSFAEHYLKQVNP